MGLTENLVSIVFIVSTIVIAVHRIFQAINGPKGRLTDVKKQIIRYLVIYYSLNFGVMITEPYVYQHYLDSGTSPQEITAIFTTPYVINAIYRFIPIKIVKFVGTTPFIVTGAIFCSLATLLRTKKNFDALMVSQVLVVMARNSFDLSCSDWKFGEGSHEKSGDVFFRNVVAAAKAVMTAIITFISIYIKKTYDTQLLLYFGTGISLIALATSLLVYKKKAYPVRKDSIRPTKYALAIICFFTVFEVYFTPRLLSYIQDQNTSIPLAALFATVILMNIAGEGITQSLDNSNNPEKVIAITAGLSSILIAIIIITYNFKWLVFLLALPVIILAKIGRMTIEKIGNTPAELIVLYAAMAYGGYKLGGETTSDVDLKIACVSAALAAVMAFIKMRKEPVNNGNDEDQEDVI